MQHDMIVIRFWSQMTVRLSTTEYRVYVCRLNNNMNILGLRMGSMEIMEFHRSIVTICFLSAGFEISKGSCLN